MNCFWWIYSLYAFNRTWIHIWWVFWLCVNMSYHLPVVIYILVVFNTQYIIIENKFGSLWSWLYGSWIYNYLYNQCLSPLKLWVRIPLRRSVLHTTLSDKVCHWLAAGWWFSPGTPVSSNNKTDCHDITEILMKVALNTITLKVYVSNITIIILVQSHYLNYQNACPSHVTLNWHKQLECLHQLIKYDKFNQN